MTKFDKNSEITVVGAGLAGSECSLQLARLGYKVHLIEMRDENITDSTTDKAMTPAHRTHKFAELVCSNSFGSISEGSAPSQLKWEAQKLNGFIIEKAFQAQVPAGQALGVDREVFSQLVTEEIEKNKNIRISRKIVKSLNELPRPCVIATGPLTHSELADDLKNHFGNEFCYFFDAIAPIIDTDSINTEIAWKADRYDKGTPDYFNCPMDKEQYFNFINEVKAARKIEPKHFETTDFFEGCMPIEVMVDRGPHTLRFGPMKPVGLKNPKTGRDAYAIVQLRQDNKEGTAYNMVGFQTRMAYSEQIRVFKTIPGLENAEFLKLGSIHRNLYIHAPTQLNKNLTSKKDENLFFAGQITGVEGYFESTCTGLLAAIAIDQKIKGNDFILPPKTTAIGALIEAITDETKAKHFQPTNINFGLLPPLEQQEKDKSIKKQKQIDRARVDFENWMQNFS